LNLFSRAEPVFCCIFRRSNASLLSDPFNSEREVKIAAAKAVLLATSLLNDQALEFEIYIGSEEQLEELRTAELSTIHSAYNRLKGILPEAFFYLYKSENCHSL